MITNWPQGSTSVCVHVCVHACIQLKVSHPWMGGGGGEGAGERGRVQSDGSVVVPVWD